MKDMGKQLRNVVLILALIAVAVLVSFQAGKKEGTRIAGVTEDNKINLELMSKVRSELSKKYLDKDKMDEAKMSYGSIEGMVAALGDPYTVFLPPKENKSANEDLSGEFGGVGIQLGYKEKTLAVIAPLPKTPAEKAGIQAGDLILKIIDKEKGVDKETVGISLEEAMGLIRGKVDSEVTLRLYREGKSDTFDVVLKREVIVVPSMEMEWVKKGSKEVAWVKLYKFSEQTYNDWPKYVEEINSKKMELGSNFGGIVLDLRNNPGGYLQASVVVASDFLKGGTVVTQKSSDGREEVYKVDQSLGRLIKDKLVVLINSGSASAAEILAGALKDYHRAKLVGVKSFGKGTVQEPIDFKDGSGLHITIAKWLLPGGKNIHNEGVEPDVEVKWDEKQAIGEDNQLDKAIEFLLQNENNQ